MRAGVQENWKPRRLGGGYGGRIKSSQIRFGGRDRPFGLEGDKQKAVKVDNDVDGLTINTNISQINNGKYQRLGRNVNKLQ